MILKEREGLYLKPESDGVRNCPLKLSQSTVEVQGKNKFKAPKFQMVK